MNPQKIIISKALTHDLAEILSAHRHDKLFVLTDTHTHHYCMPHLRQIDEVNHAEEIITGAGDAHKTLDTLSNVWQVLSRRGATRHSLLINLGGGMITDLGGFAASTFKRGIAYINIPTTLLAMVDAAVGGKTGINFNTLKNEIGVFAPATHVIIDVEFLETLDRENLLSGYAEMLKHALIDDTRHWAELLTWNSQQVDYRQLSHWVERSIQTKERYVKQDPLEENIRKALNFGHTVGHAFESLALVEKHPVLHGYAVAWGMVCELYLSCIRAGFPTDKMRQTAAFIKENYSYYPLDCNHYDRLYEFMLHDKKNLSADTLNFTLLEDIGKVRIDQTADKHTLFEAFDFYRECMGL
jgi:3-dehydroquinate synthase